MIPVILLIAKLAIAVPAAKGSMTREQLDEYLKVATQHGGDALSTLLQNEVDSTTRLLVAVHSALVLLEASIRDFDPQDNNQMSVSAFTPDLVDKDQNGEVVGGLIKKSETLIKSVTEVDPEFSRIPRICRKNYGNNLKVCFRQAKNLPDNFNVEECIKACFNSAQNLVKHTNYLEGALELIRHILLMADLKKVEKLLQSAPPNPVDDTPDWLDKQLGLSKLIDDLATPQNLDADAKLSLSRIKAMIDQDSHFYVETLQRLEFGPGEQDDIKEVVTTISADLTEEKKKSWRNLQQALYRAIGWHIFHEAELVAHRTKILLEHFST